jgi:hypothetical protein
MSNLDYFLGWAKGLSDALTAVGFLKTEDTGQIDWGTVDAKPASSYQMIGYEIRAFSDALQSSNPVIVKIEYGCGSSTSYTGLRITVGRATDGAGNLVGEKTDRYDISNSNSTATAYTCFVSGAQDRIAFVLFANATSYMKFFYIERLKSSIGLNLSTGIDIIWSKPNVHYQQFFPKAGLAYPISLISGNICCLCPPAGSASYGGNIGVFPVLPNLGYAENPDLGACVYFTSDIPYNTDIELTILETTHTYKTIGGSIGTINGNSIAKSIAMRYE